MGSHFPLGDLAGHHPYHQRCLVLLCRLLLMPPPHPPPLPLPSLHLPCRASAVFPCSSQFRTQCRPAALGISDAVTKQPWVLRHWVGFLLPSWKSSFPKPLHACCLQPSFLRRGLWSKTFPPGSLALTPNSLTDSPPCTL